MKTIEVVAGIIKQNGKIFCSARGYGDYKGFWEFPGGKIEQGETREQALARELKEELDIDVSVGNHVITVEYDYPTFHLTMHCFYCEIVHGEIKLLEHEDAKWMLPSEMHTLKWLPADDAIIEKIAAI